MNYIVMFHDKQSIKVSEERGEKIKELFRKKAHSFEIGKALYAVSSITRIVPEKVNQENVAIPKLEAPGKNVVRKETLVRIKRQLKEKFRWK